MKSPKAIREFIRKIEPLADRDPEHFHGEVDDMYRTVMRHIANGALDDPKACAMAVVEVERIKARWSAGA
jgi:hypothetical protein